MIELPGLEEPAVALAAAVVRSAVGIWLKDPMLTSDGSIGIAEVFGRRASDYFQKSRAIRTYDQMAEEVARKIIPLLEREYRSVPDNERTAAIRAVAETFSVASLSGEDIYQSDLSAGYIQRQLGPQSASTLEKFLLSDGATQLYQLLLRECCEYLVQVVKSLPDFQSNALTQLLARSTQTINYLQDLLDRLPAREQGDKAQDASVTYRRQVINILDEMELFGASLTESSRHYPLGLAYISLSVVSGKHHEKDDEDGCDPADRDHQEVLDSIVSAVKRRQTQRVSIESVLQSAPRVFIRGEAGSGKTTILKWLAVRAAERSLPAVLSAKNNFIPFYIPLRRYSEREFPIPSEFVNSVGRDLAEDLPKRWVSGQLRSGHAMVLIDGIDELPEARRRDAHTWIRQLITSYKNVTFVVTSRPGAVPADWLVRQSFSVYALQPMDSNDIRTFVEQWHAAVGSQMSDQAERRELLEYMPNLLDQILTHNHLRRTAETPLLCALICALNRERRGNLPASRLELYEIALAMLLERRDLESNIMLDAELSRAQKIIILQDIAYWLVRNGWADADRNDVIAHIARKLLNMPKIRIDATETYRRLLERSGLIREPSYRRVDFIHKSFQEYLAAKEALGVGDTGLLINNGHMDQWRDVVVMAAGLADAKRGREILTSLLARGDAEPKNRKKLNLVAMACLETCHEILPAIRTDIQTRVRPLLPPRELDSIKDLVSCGDIALELLSDMEITDENQVSASIRLAGEIASELALDFIRNYRMSTRSSVLDEIRRAWPRFDVIHFAESIVKGSSLDARYLWVSDSETVASLGLLDRVQHVECSFPIGEQNIRQLCALPRLRKLTIKVSEPDLLKLPRIATFEELNVAIYEFGNEKLRRLAGVPHIRSLTIDGSNNWISDYRPLEWFRHLTELRIYASSIDSTEADIVDMLLNNRIVEQLSVLVVANDSYLAYMEQLERLSDPETIGIVSCRSFRELSGISAWSSSLRHLSISDTDVRSLNPLARLSHLEILDVSRTRVKDLSPIGKLGSLRAINLTGCDSELSVGPVLDLPSIEFVIMPDGALWQAAGDKDRVLVELEPGDPALQWRVCQKLMGGQFVPTVGGRGYDLDTDGSRWPDPV